MNNNREYEIRRILIGLVDEYSKRNVSCDSLQIATNQILDIVKEEQLNSPYNTLMKTLVKMGADTLLMQNSHLTSAVRGQVVGAIEMIEKDRLTLKLNTLYRENCELRDIIRDKEINSKIS